MDYQFVKLLHILSSTLLFGTGLGTAFYMWRAHCCGDLNTFRLVAKNVVMADWLFTAPSIIIQPLTGIAMIHLAGLDWRQPWLLWSIGLFLIAGACWVPVVFIQIKVSRLLEHSQPDALRINQLMWVWYSLGVPAFLAVIGIFILMVLKTALTG